MCAENFPDTKSAPPFLGPRTATRDVLHVSGLVTMKTSLIVAAVLCLWMLADRTDLHRYFQFMHHP